MRNLDFSCHRITVAYLLAIVVDFIEVFSVVNRRLIILLLLTRTSMQHCCEMC